MLANLFFSRNNQEFISVSEEMLSKSKALIVALKAKAPAAEIVGTCKEFVSLTRNLDSCLDELAAQEQGAKAEALNVSVTESLRLLS
jgi:hypothetical protein